MFAVGLQSPAYQAGPLKQMASGTGGEYVEANTPEALRPLVASIGRQLAREFLLEYQTRQNPNTKVDVRVKVAGIPGVATSQYETPKLVIKPVPPYRPSTFDRVAQSRWTMLAVALIIAALVGWAVRTFTSQRDDALVDRVSGFVAVPSAGSAVADPSSEQPGARSRFLTRISASTSKSNWSERMAETLELADIEAEPVQVVILTAAGTVFAMVVLYLIGGPLLCLLGLLVPVGVRVWIHNKVTRKRKAFAEQLPDNLDVLASALRAGHSLVGALTVVADDATEPSKAEFRRVLQEEQFGVDLEDALQIAVKRMDNQDLDQVALVARLQREVGSNSAEVLDRVIETVRSRMELRRLVRSLTAQGRLSRWILTALPVALALILIVIGHDYMKPLYTETLGKALLVVATLMVILGSWMIGKIVDIRI